MLPPGSLKIFIASALAVGPSFLFASKYRLILRQMAGEVRITNLVLIEQLTWNILIHIVGYS